MKHKGVLKHVPKTHQIYDAGRSLKQARELAKAYEPAVYSPRVVSTPKYKQFPYHIAVLKKPRYYLRSMYPKKK